MYLYTGFRNEQYIYIHKMRLNWAFNSVDAIIFLWNHHIVISKTPATSPDQTRPTHLCLNHIPVETNRHGLKIEVRLNKAWNFIERCWGWPQNSGLVWSDRLIFKVDLAICQDATIKTLPLTYATAIYITSCFKAVPVTE